MVQSLWHSATREMVGQLDRRSGKETERLGDAAPVSGGEDMCYEHFLVA